jgi:hypothetical protein
MPDAGAPRMPGLPAAGGTAPPGISRPKAAQGNENETRPPEAVDKVPGTAAVPPRNDTPRQDNDLKPAKSAGMRTAFIRRGPWGSIWERDPDMQSAADWRMETLAELPAIVASIRQSAERGVPVIEPLDGLGAARDDVPASVLGACGMLLFGTAALVECFVGGVPSVGG